MSFRITPECRVDISFFMFMKVEVRVVAPVGGYGRELTGDVWRVPADSGVGLPAEFLSTPFGQAMRPQ